MLSYLESIYSCLDSGQYPLDFQEDLLNLNDLIKSNLLTVREMFFYIEYIEPLLKGQSTMTKSL